MNKIIKSILVILYYFAFNIAIFIPFIAFDINTSSIPDALFNVYYISVDAIFYISLYFIYRNDFTTYIEDFKHNGKSYARIGFKYWVVGLFVMIVSNVLISTFSPISLPENEQAVREALKISPIFMVISSVIDAPIIEEILFRKTLFDIFKNKKLFIVISGLIFGSFHIIGVATTAASWLYIIPYAALGMAFAYAFVKTNNLLTPMGMHAFHNFITVMQILLLM